MLTRYRSRATTLCLVGLAMTAGLAGVTPAAAADIVPYRGTDKADRIDFRYSSTRYNITALGGNDTVFAGNEADIVDGGKGRDTIEPGSGNDTVRGGPDGDYFRYETSYDGFRYLSGSDLICDFGSGDKLDVFTSFLDDNGSPETVRGGNFKLFDTNKDGVINKNDKFSVVKKLKSCGKSKDSLVLDLRAAFTAADEDDPGESGTLTVYGKTSLKKSEFVLDYFHDYPY